MTVEDQHACADVIMSWGLYRDQRRWPELLSTFHPDGEIAVSWFRGPFAEFVEHCKRGGPSKHLIMAPLVRVNGARATAETSDRHHRAAGDRRLAVDMTSRARFLDRLERRDGGWKILERAAVYEQDRLDPVVPSEGFAHMMREADVGEVSRALSLHGVPARRRRPAAGGAGALRRRRRTRRRSGRATRQWLAGQ